MAEEILTQARLKELIHYCPKTGEFTRLSSVRNAPAGRIANKNNTKGYVQIMVDGMRYLKHRLAFLYVEGIFPSLQVDHINRDKTDTRWANLRHATPALNALNKNKSSGSGVSVNSRAKVFVARIGNTQLYWGKDLFEAYCARKSEENKRLQINH